ncbi:ABC transporter, ATP-binding protein [Geotalea daltonii FRC-32]|uniref:ABC transporter, ATP-binding protein n=1 Tax=Geotalea daltonii (strain DSM 22248 / JCM 15807 / FRC-32) TaxID=316067 RepID=B9M527_GEODF|nr:ABC transporter ATP-binding protein [Geotalea daltonii]ACM21711.1 ABC transporter, ATP-binding protein [Geotalea daltonii FRC-32]
MVDSISFVEVWKTYERELGSVSQPALRGVTFSVRQGETLGLIGANGAGKSTCIRLIMDFIRPSQGVITLNGRSPDKSSLRHDIGYLPEIASFPASLTILDMLRFVGAAHDLPKTVLAEQSERWLRALELWDARKRPIRTYSKGMQQRASFVLALVHDPSLLILDEPMSGLDPIGRASIGRLIQDLKGQGKTILFCTHILEDVDRLADRLLILHKGEKRFEGTPSELSMAFGTTSIVDGFLHAIEVTQS